MQDELYQIKEDYIREILKLYREKGLSKESVAMLDMMIHSAKNLCKIVESMEEAYSMANYDMYSGAGGNSYRNSYAGGNSYARGRGSGANRDSMGRYSSRGMSGGYSTHDDMRSEIYDLMNRTSDESTRRELQEIANRM